MTQRRVLLVCLACLSLWATGCGWQLRGTAADQQLDATGYPMYIDAGDAGLLAALRSEARARGVELVTQADQADFVIEVADTQVNDRLLTVTAAIHERQRRLEKTALYSIRSGTRVLAENTHVLQWRDYLHDETNAAASEREQAFLRSEIDAALARQILQHATTFAGAARANRYAPES